MLQGAWKRDVVTNTESQAKAWLNELANIGEPANKTELTAAIDPAALLIAEQYTSASWVAFANALADAQTVETMESPSQSRVNDALLALTLAQAALVERV